MDSFAWLKARIHRKPVIIEGDFLKLQRYDTEYKCFVEFKIFKKYIQRVASDVEGTTTLALNQSYYVQGRWVRTVEVNHPAPEVLAAVWGDNWEELNKS